MDSGGMGELGKEEDADGGAVLAMQELGLEGRLIANDKDVRAGV